MYGPLVAVLEHLGDGTRYAVAAQSLIGRSPACVVRLTVAEASSEHAKLVWTAGERWGIRDLGSKNGTFVDGKAIAPGAEVILDAGARLAFGDAMDVWRLTDDGPPELVAAPTVGGPGVAADRGLLVLPSIDDPQLTVFRDPTGQWVAERADGLVDPVDDHEVVRAGDGRWRIHLPAESEGTPLVMSAMTLDDITLRLAVSQDEEQVQVTVLHRGREIPLERREHGYLLLTMARGRQAERDKPLDSRGWMKRDDLLTMFKMDTNAFNVAVHRARHQLLAAGVEGAAGIVEVRRAERRFGIDRFELTTLGQ